MTDSFFFYDLETTGVSPREARIVQFAGQRTDLDLQPMDEPFNLMLRLSDDILPDPDAVLVTGITPQQSREEGITEAEFLEIFNSQIAKPGTVFVGYNTVRFDDEFMRYMLYRNFYDPYEWQWKDGRSRWDLLDVVRLTRALRPDGIRWPFASDGSPTNRLELLTQINDLDHDNAHDALNDVQATISLARLLHSKQPKLFEYLFKMRDKNAVKRLIEVNEPFVYASGKYSGEHEKTTVVQRIGDVPKDGGVLVYDLRFNPAPFIDMSPEDLAKIWQWQKDPDAVRLPVKTLKFNRCPAVAPLAVLDPDSQERLHIQLADIAKNRKALAEATHWPQRLYKALEIITNARQERLIESPQTADNALYDSFLKDADKHLFVGIHRCLPERLSDFAAKLQDKRLIELLPLYKARNFPKSLNENERALWDKFVSDRLFLGGDSSRLAKYLARINELQALPTTTKKQQYLLEDLRLYGESIVPSD